MYGLWTDGHIGDINEQGQSYERNPKKIRGIANVIVIIICSSFVSQSLFLFTNEQVMLKVEIVFSM